MEHRCTEEVSINPGSRPRARPAAHPPAAAATAAGMLLLGLLAPAAVGLLWFPDAPNNLAGVDGVTAGDGSFHLRYDNSACNASDATGRCASGPGGHCTVAVGHSFGGASSSDGVHWNDSGSMMWPFDQGVTCPATHSGCGSVWRAVQQPHSNAGAEEQWVINYSDDQQPRPTSTMRFMTSKNPGGPWAPLGAANKQAGWGPGHVPPRPQDGAEIYKRGCFNCMNTWEAPPSNPKVSPARMYGWWTTWAKQDQQHAFGFASSVDGLSWSAQPPARIEMGTHNLTGDVSSLPLENGGCAWAATAERWVCMLGFRGGWAWVDGFVGMAAFVSKNPGGPYRLADRNPFLMSYKNPQVWSEGGDTPTYFSRFWRRYDAQKQATELLVVHLSFVTKNNNRKYVPPDQDTCASYMAPLKKAEVDPSGSLLLKYWSGNEKMKGPLQPVTLEPLTEGVRPLSSALNNRNGTVLEGQWQLTPQGGCGAGAIILYGDNNSLGWQRELIAFEIGVNSSQAMNIYLLDAVGARVTLLESAERRIDVQPPQSCSFRVLLRGSMAEVYANDVLLLPVPLPHTVSATGGLSSWAQGFRAPTVRAALTGSWARAKLKAWTMSLLPLFPMKNDDDAAPSFDFYDTEDGVLEVYAGISNQQSNPYYGKATLVANTASAQWPASLLSESAPSTLKTDDGPPKGRHQAYYKLFGDDIDGGVGKPASNWPSKFSQYSVFITSPGLSDIQIWKVRRDIPNATILAYTDLSFVYAGATGPTGCCTDKLGNFSQYWNNSWAVTNLRTGLPVCPFGAVASPIDPNPKGLLPIAVGVMFKEAADAVVRYHKEITMSRDFDGIYIDDFMQEMPTGWTNNVVAITNNSFDVDNDGLPDTLATMATKYTAGKAYFSAQMRLMLGPGKYLSANTGSRACATCPDLSPDPALDGQSIEFEWCTASRGGLAACHAALQSQHVVALAQRRQVVPFSLMWLTERTIIEPAIQCAQLRQLQRTMPWILAGVDHSDNTWPATGPCSNCSESCTPPPPPLVSAPFFILPLSTASQMRRATKDVRRYIFQMSKELGSLGGPKVISKENASAGVIIGQASDFVSAVASGRLELDLPDDLIASVQAGPEGAHLVRSVYTASGQPVILCVGRDTQAALYAVYTMLEVLGIRFRIDGDTVPTPTNGTHRTAVALLNDIAACQATARVLRPSFAWRGLVPFHDFLAGPDLWK